MSAIIVRDMQSKDEYFVSTCSHVHESSEIDHCAKERRQQFHSMKSEGTVFKVALQDHNHVGFAYGIPVERSPWGPIGQSLMVIPCMYVLPQRTSGGVGKALLASMERAAEERSFKAVIVTGYRDIPGAEWFMPASYFETLGYTPIESRGREILLWKPFDSSAKPPHFLQPHYVFEPIDGHVVVDLFWNAFCATSVIEAQRVREVCKEFGDCVILREFRAEDRDTLLHYQMPRAIFVNGREIGWGYEAPKEGIRDAIRTALS